VSRGCLGARGGELRGVARGNRHARASPAGNAAGGSGWQVGGTTMGVWGAARGGYARESRGNRIMSLGRGSSGRGGERRGRAAVHRAPRG
jgi:hypothetical protein